MIDMSGIICLRCIDDDMILYENLDRGYEIYIPQTAT